MGSSTRLDSAVFQLTPTRTRCDLVVSANGKTEKIAAGLLNPFLAHLRSAQDQMAKGGYSIVLEPEPGVEAPWFTKSTVERFVRFVSTPEVLERVYSIESEISQICKAIAVQSTNDMGAENHQGKPVESLEDSNEEKAIVLYKPEAHPPEAHGSVAEDRNSKVQLLRVLETRKTLLEKEQGMAFARAAVAGFDIDHMAPLISFAECFGASRLKDACKRYEELWKRKHETGQWLEIEGAEVTMNASSYNELAPGSNGKITPETNTDQKPPINHQFSQSQFPHHIYAPWTGQSTSGALPNFQTHPMQGMPYYNNYPGNNPFFHSPYPSEDPRLNAGQRIRQKRHSMDGRDSNTESEIWEMDGSRTRLQDEMELEEGSQNRESRKNSGRSGKKQSGMVVIRNINYITSKKESSSGSESESAACSEVEEEDGQLQAITPEKRHKSVTSSKRREIRNSSEKEESGHWHAFQNLLLRDADDEKGSLDKGMFANEEVRMRKRQNMMEDDPMIHGGNGMRKIREKNMTDLHEVSGIMTHISRPSHDEVLYSQQDGRINDGKSKNDHMDTELDSRRVGYGRLTDDDFMIHRRENQSGFTRSSDSLAVNRFQVVNSTSEGRSSQNMDHDSYIVPFRATSPNQAGTDDRKAIDMDLELPSALQKAKSNRVGIQVHYEPHDLSLMPGRGIEKGSSSYDPALDYVMQVCGKDITSLDKKNKVAVAEKQGSKKLDYDRKKRTPDSSDKKKTEGPIRKGKSSKLSPLDEARARAEKLRTYKADLLKMKKEKEDEEKRRLENLKIERQKRIATRGGSSIPTRSSSVLQQTRRQLPTRLSVSSLRGSKLSDPERSNGSQSAGNKISQSVTTDTKASMSRIRRLSEPTMSSSRHLSSVKTPSAGLISKPKGNGSESKKISAITNLDKTKAATLPGLKIRTSKAPDAAQGISTDKK